MGNIRPPAYCLLCPCTIRTLSKLILDQMSQIGVFHSDSWAHFRAVLWLANGR